MSTRFEPGAPASRDSIPLCVPELGGNEWTYVRECLDTNFVSSVGPFVDRFERELAARLGMARAVATTSGTAALHVALLVAGVQPDDEVFVPTLTFIAPVNAIRYAGAWPLFVDAEPTYWQMDVTKLAAFIEHQCGWNGRELRNRRTGRRIRAVLPVHVLGHPVDMDPLLAIARRYELAVIEDATESLGALYKGRPLGCLGDIGCFSFNGNKIITTGGGGMLVTRREGWARHARYLTTQAKDDPFEFVHSAVGFNYRLTNVQAAIGCAQLELLDEYIIRKQRIAQRYADALAGLPGVTVMPQAPWAGSTFWLYTILIEEAVAGVGSRPLLAALDTAGIQARPLWQPIHRSPAHQGDHEPCPVAERLNAQAVSLPSSVGLTSEQQARVINALLAVLGTARVASSVARP